MATDFYQVVETSDVPGGVLNIVTGEARGARCRRSRATTTSTRSGASATRRISAMVERASVGNLKRTFTDYGHACSTGSMPCERGAGRFCARPCR